MQNTVNFSIKEVKSKKEQRDFVKFPLKLYKNNPYFVPALYMDEMKLFKKNNGHSECETIYFNCYDGKKVVGRISGIIQHQANKKWNQSRVRFTRFDSIDNQEVANMLFSNVEKWAKEKGIEEIVGPLGFSDLDREGLLIEGFEELSTFEEQYNYPYYEKLVENYGFQKEVDWVERQVRAPLEIDPRYERISNRMLQKYNLRFTDCKTTNEFIKRYKDQFFEILDKTYDNLYGTVPFTDEMKKELISEFRLFINVKFISTIVDENDRIVAFGLIIPSIAKAVQKSKGRLTIPAIIRILKASKKPKILDFGLVGVIDEYRSKGIASAMFYKIMVYLKEGNVEYAETNLNLEDNSSMINQWKSFDTRLHKRRRSYVKKID